jgi:hypothetical protein
MDERDRERVIVDQDASTPPTHVERETTIIHTGDRGGGSGALIAAVVLLLVVGAVLFFLFGGLERTAEETDINVNVETPEIKLPDVDIDLPEAPVEPADGNSQ